MDDYPRGSIQDNITYWYEGKKYSGVLATALHTYTFLHVYILQ